MHICKYVEKDLETEANSFALVGKALQHLYFIPYPSVLLF